MTSAKADYEKQIASLSAQLDVALEDAQKNKELLADLKKKQNSQEQKRATETRNALTNLEQSNEKMAQDISDKDAEIELLLGEIKNTKQLEK